MAEDPRRGTATGPAARTRRRRRPIASEAELHEAALSYLDRFPCSVARLRRHLKKKLAAADAPEGGEAWIDAVCARLLRVGILDDGRYAASRARVLHGRGKGARFIARDLRGRGLAADDVTSALAALQETHAQQADLVAAIKLARRRKLGPWRAGASDHAIRRRHLATLARAGFTFDIARQVIDTAEPDVLEALVAPRW